MRCCQWRQTPQIASEPSRLAIRPRRRSIAAGEPASTMPTIFEGPSSVLRVRAVACVEADRPKNAGSPAKRPGGKEPFCVLAKQIRFEVHRVANLAFPQGGDFSRVRDDPDAKAFFSGRRHRKADAVHGN